jgi:hypothetical protein
MSLQNRVDDAYDWFGALSLSVRIWLVTLVGGLLVVPLTQGASIGLLLAGILTGLIARLMYD